MKEVRPIVLYPNPVLREISKPVDKDYPVKELVEEMTEIVNSAENGVGLAAVQIGVPVRIFLGYNNKPFINPEVIQAKGSDPRGHEGCLSMPGVGGYKRRNQKIKLKWYDTDWNEHTALFKGFEAVVIQHELDHLDGILFTDNMDDRDKDWDFNKTMQDLLEGNPPDRNYKMEPYVGDAI